MGLLPVHTEFSPQKARTRRTAVACAPFAGAALEGYEIHMGRTWREEGTAPFCLLEGGTSDGAVRGAVFGTYLHGLFETGALTGRLAEYLAARRGLTLGEAPVEGRAAFKERQYDLLADTVRAHLDLDAVYRAMEEFSHGAD